MKIKAKVKKDFMDIHTNVLHEVGEELEISQERLEEIQSVDPALVSVISDEPKVKVEEPEEPKEQKDPKPKAKAKSAPKKKGNK